MGWFANRCRRRSDRSQLDASAGSVAPYRLRLLCVLGALFVCALCGCDEQILHDLSEQDANKVLSRLGNESLGAKKVLQSDGRWAIAVERRSVVMALSYLDTNRVLSPRSAVGHSTQRGGFVPSREEQWFRYERSVALSLEDSLNTIAGVLEARVHLNLPETDPLFGTRKELTGSGSVLLVIDDRYASNDQDIAALVAGAAGIPLQKVTVLRSRPPMVEVEEVSQKPAEREIVMAEQSVAVSQHPEPHSAAAEPVTGVLHSNTGAVSAAFVVLVGTGAVLCARRKRRVKFVLPRASEEEE